MSCPRFTLCAALAAAVFACGRLNGVSDLATSDRVRSDAPANPAAGGDARSDAVRVQILAINDFHGNIQPPAGSSGLVKARRSDPILARHPKAELHVDEATDTATITTGGAVYLATHIRELRAANPNTVVVGAGDLTGASPMLSNMFRDIPTVQVMNAIGLDFEGVGNHEFDRGIGELLRLQNGGCSGGKCMKGVYFTGATFQYLAANVTNAASKSSVFPAYGIKEMGGVKVGFIGLTLEKTAEHTITSAVQGITFASEAKTVNALVPQLNALGVHAIVLLVHEGGAQGAGGTYDSCESFTGDILPVIHGRPEVGQPPLDRSIGVIVSAHTHEPYNCVIDDRIVTSAASNGRLLTKIDLAIDRETGAIVEKSARNLPVTRDVDRDAEVDGIVAEFEAKAAPIANRVVGHITADLISTPPVGTINSCESALGDVVADAQLAATKDEATGNAQIALVNSAGMRTNLFFSEPGKANGTITYENAFLVLPFSNALVTISLTGDQLVAVLNEQFTTPEPRILQISHGLEYRYRWNADTHKGAVEPGSVKLNGEPLVASKMYRVTSNAFLAEGGEHFPTMALGVDRTIGAIDVDALVDHLEKSSRPSAPLAPLPPSRIFGNGCK